MQVGYISRYENNWVTSYDASPEHAQTIEREYEEANAVSDPLDILIELEENYEYTFHKVK